MSLLARFALHQPEEAVCRLSFAVAMVVVSRLDTRLLKVAHARGITLPPVPRRKSEIINLSPLAHLSLASFHHDPETTMATEASFLVHNLIQLVSVLLFRPKCRLPPHLPPLVDTDSRLVGVVHEKLL